MVADYSKRATPATRDKNATLVKPIRLNGHGGALACAVLLSDEKGGSYRLARNLLKQAQQVAR